MDILFYHLERKPLDAVLPGLLEKTLERGQTAFIKVGSPERLKALDDHLWTYRDDMFLPHGTSEEGKPESQPILLCLHDTNVNSASYIFIVDNAELPEQSAMEATHVERIIILFDGNDPDALDKARSQWKTLKTTSHALTYWQQAENGRWEKRA